MVSIGRLRQDVIETVVSCRGILWAALSGDQPHKKSFHMVEEAGAMAGAIVPVRL